MSLLNFNDCNRVRIVADDLTGACDAAAPFASRGATTQVQLSAPYMDSAAHVQSVCTASRDIRAREACDVVRSLITSLAKDRNAELFKKIDSVFRGNTMFELSAALSAAPAHLAVIAPAFPAQGRLCVDGHLYRTDAAGCEALNLRRLFSAVFMDLRWLAPSDEPGHLAESMRHAAGVLCEATTQQHLRTIVQAAQSLARPILWIGSAGLAHALAEALFPGFQPSALLQPHTSRLLILSGSRHPVTARQVAALGAHADVLCIHPTRTSDNDLRAFVHSPLEQASITLLLNGGDTALRVCRALRIESLCLQGEYAPGIPLATARGGRLQGMQVLLKSGGFGEADLFAKLAGDPQS